MAIHLNLRQTPLTVHVSATAIKFNTFDNHLFGINNMEAERMDPQQKLLIECTYKALEDAGVPVESVSGTRTVNQNGRSTTPITRPSQIEQEKLLRSIYGIRVDPSVVQYIEAHGTGTPAGDPIEAESLGSAISKNRSSRVSILKIGSVKGNIGHTESAAGAAGLIKVLLMMHHGKIVPSLHYSKEMSSIDTEKLNLAVASAVEPWEESSEYGRVAGINCFGFGGTNAHVVVRQVRQPEPLPAFKKPLELVVLSAASPKSLQMTLADTAEQLSTRNSVTLPSLAYTSACRRSHANYRYRKAFVTNSLRHLQQELKSAASTEPAMSKVDPQLVFVFCGNGVTLKEFSEALLSSEPVFRDKCKEIEDLFQQHAAISLLPARNHSPKDLLNPELSQPLLFALQVALASLLKHWGIKPVAVVGHSVGEVAAAHIAGYLSLADAVKVIYHRSRLQAKTASGRMLVVGNIPVEEIAERLHAYSGKVCIAAFNSPVSCTLSGSVDAVEAVQRELAEAFRQRNIFLHVLNAPLTYHSPSMDMILGELEEQIEPLEKQKGEMEVISTLTGMAASENDFAQGKFWAQHTREPVAFTQAIQTAAQGRENVVFVEISPHRALQRSIKETLGKGTKVLSSLQTDAEYQTLFNLVGNLFELGFNPNWQHFYNGYQSVPVAIPRYQFDRQKLMACLDIHQQANQRGVSASHPLIYGINSDNVEFGCLVSQDTTPYLYEHKNNGVALVPGAFYVELGLACVMSSSRPKVPLSTCQLSISFSAPCVLTHNSQVLSIKLSAQKAMTTFEVLSSSNAVYAAGQVAKGLEGVVEESSISFQAIYRRCKSVISREEVYEALSHVGFQYGSVFRQLGNVHYCQELKEAITSIKVNEETIRDMYSHCIHPVLLDCFLQMTAVLSSRTLQSRAGFPSGIGSLVVLRPLEEEMMIYMRMSKSTGNCLEVCGCFMDKHGSVLAELKRVAITFMKESSSRDNEFLFENRWKEVSLSQTIGHLGFKPRVLVFADKFGIAEQLKKHLHPASRYVMYEGWESLLEGDTQNKMRAEVEDYDEILFLWGIQKLNEDFPGKAVDQLAKCCEAYRQVVVALREKTSRCSVRVITYRTTDRYVDHINCGFALYGMTRTCIAEVPEITFQLIDLSSSTSLDISVLADVLVKYKAPLKELQKTVHAWISSMDVKQFRNLSGCVFQQPENFEGLHSVTSYFTCTSVPLAVLRRQKDMGVLSDIPLYKPQQQLFKQNAVYVVAGGLTGLGFETVKFIAENGGGCIAILSRRIPSREKQEEMRALQQQYKGSKVVSVQCDVISTSDVEKAFQSIANTFVGSPIKGIFQSAVALHDGRLEVLKLADFHKVLSPKVAGTLNLHRATRGQELDYFVCYSSVTSFLGNATQTNYAAANSFLDFFCLYRRNCGLSGQAINWGALNLGVLLNQNHIQSVLGSKGIDILQMHEIHDYLRKTLLINNPQQAVVKLNFQTLYHHVFPKNISLKSRFVSVISEDFRNKIEMSEETEVSETAFLKSEDYITSLVSDLTGVNTDELTMNTPLSSLGIDSMLAMTIQNRVFKERKVDIPLVKLLDPHTTLSSLVVVLEETGNANGAAEKKNAVVE
ncbi:Phenolphthiocerol synthesis polyketide synthase type I Pks15/1, partial [Lamprotornis superbus]